MNTINDLRTALFDTLKQLQDKESPMELDRAKAVSEIAQTIINTAKVEVDYMKVTGEHGQSKFITIEDDQQRTNSGRIEHRQNDDGTTSRIHKMR